MSSASRRAHRAARRLACGRGDRPRAAAQRSRPGHSPPAWLPSREIGQPQKVCGGGAASQGRALYPRPAPGGAGCVPGPRTFCAGARGLGLSARVRRPYSDADSPPDKAPLRRRWARHSGPAEWRRRWPCPSCLVAPARASSAPGPRAAGSGSRVGPRSGSPCARVSGAPQSARRKIKVGAARRRLLCGGCGRRGRPWSCVLRSAGRAEGGRQGAPARGKAAPARRGRDCAACGPRSLILKKFGLT